MPLEEEAEGPLQADDEGQAGHKQDLRPGRYSEDEITRARGAEGLGDVSGSSSTHVSDGQQGFVEEQDHPEEEEEHAEARQPHPDLCKQTLSVLQFSLFLKKPETQCVNATKDVGEKPVDRSKILH